MDDPHLQECVQAFGNRIRELRISRELSQELLADMAGIDRSYLGHIERGKLNVTIIKVFQVAKALDVMPEVLFEGVDPR